jgi:hypothetical protein
LALLPFDPLKKQYRAAVDFKKKNMITKTKINQQRIIPFALSPQKMAVLLSTFFPAEAGTTIATPLFTNSTPFFGN